MVLEIFGMKVQHGWLNSKLFFLGWISGLLLMKVKLNVFDEIYTFIV